MYNGTIKQSTNSTLRGGGVTDTTAAAAATATATVKTSIIVIIRDYFTNYTKKHKILRVLDDGASVTTKNTHLVISTIEVSMLRPDFALVS